MKRLSKLERVLISLRERDYPIYKKDKTLPDEQQNWVKVVDEESWCFGKYDYKDDIMELPLDFSFEAFGEIVVKMYIILDEVKYIIYSQNDVIKIAIYPEFYHLFKNVIEESLKTPTKLKVSNQFNEVLNNMLLAPNETSIPLIVETEATDFEVSINPTDLASFDKDLNCVVAKREGIGYIDIRAEVAGKSPTIHTINLKVAEMNEDTSVRLDFIMETGNKYIRVNDRVKYRVKTDGTAYLVKSLDELKVSVDNANKQLVIKKEGIARIEVTATKVGRYTTTKVYTLNIKPIEVVTPDATILNLPVNVLNDLTPNSLLYVPVETELAFEDLELEVINPDIVEAEIVEPDLGNPIRIKLKTLKNGHSSIAIRGTALGKEQTEKVLDVFCIDNALPLSTISVEPSEPMEVFEQSAINYKVTANGEVEASTDNPKLLHIEKTLDGFNVITKPNVIGKGSVIFENTSNGIALGVVDISVTENPNKPAQPTIQGSNFKVSAGSSLEITIDEDLVTNPDSYEVEVIGLGNAEVIGQILTYTSDVNSLNGEVILNLYASKGGIKSLAREIIISVIATTLVVTPNELPKVTQGHVQVFDITTDALDVEITAEPSNLVEIDSNKKKVTYKEKGNVAVNFKATKDEGDTKIISINTLVEELTQLSVEPKAKSIKIAESFQYEVVTNANDYSIEADIPSLVNIDKNNKTIEALQEGRVVILIRATKEGSVENTATITLDIVADDETQLTVTPLVLNLEKGVSQILDIQTEADDYTITSKSEAIAKVKADKKTIEAIGVGSTIIDVEAEASGKNKTIKQVNVNVSEVLIPTELIVTPEGPVNIRQGEEQQFVIRSNGRFVMETEQTDIINILNNEKKIQGIKEGQAVLVIRAKADNATEVEKRVTINVTP